MKPFYFVLNLPPYDVCVSEIKRGEASSYYVDPLPRVRSFERENVVYRGHDYLVAKGYSDWQKEHGPLDSELLKTKRIKKIKASELPQLFEEFSEQD